MRVRQSLGFHYLLWHHLKVRDLLRPDCVLRLLKPYIGLRLYRYIGPMNPRMERMSVSQSGRFADLWWQRNTPMHVPLPEGSLHRPLVQEYGPWNCPSSNECPRTEGMDSIWCRQLRAPSGMSHEQLFLCYRCRTRLYNRWSTR